MQEWDHITKQSLYLHWHLSREGGNYYHCQHGIHSLSQRWKPSPRGEAESLSTIRPPEEEMSEVMEGGEPESRELESRDENFFSFGGESEQQSGNRNCSCVCPLAGIINPSLHSSWLNPCSLRSLLMRSCGQSVRPDS